MTLEDAIDQLVSLGHKDPDEIDRMLLEAHGERQLEVWAIERRHDIVNQIARQRISALRRNTEVALASPVRKVRERAQTEIVLQMVYIPDEEGIPRLVRVAEVTPEDADRKAAMYYRLGAACNQRGDWWTDNRDTMLTEGCATMGDLAKVRDIPALPELEPTTMRALTA